MKVEDKTLNMVFVLGKITSNSPKILCYIKKGEDYRIRVVTGSVKTANRIVNEFEKDMSVRIPKEFQTPTSELLSYENMTNFGWYTLEEDEFQEIIRGKVKAINIAYLKSRRKLEKLIPKKDRLDPYQFN